MISNLLKSKIILAAAFIISFSQLYSQGPVVNATVIQQPCNNNGQIAVSVTGLTPPLKFVYTNWAAMLTYTFGGVNGLSHTVTGLPAYHTDNFQTPNFWDITVSDGVNTTNTWTVLTPPFMDSIQVTPGLCPAPNTVAAVGFAGGTAPYTCVWKNKSTNQLYNGNPAQVPNGDYLITITDGAGCMVTSAPGSSINIQVSGKSTVTVSMSGTNANCTNGTATVTASGGQTPYTYLWNNGATSANLTGLSSGAYNVIVTDGQGCSTQDYYFVGQSVNIFFNTTVTNATCLQNNGSILGFASGGTAPYTYMWSNGATTSGISNVAGGIYYTAQIMDENGCKGTGGNFVSQSTPISLTYISSPSSCTASTGAATITPAGGQTPYSITWLSTFPNQSGPTATNLQVGFHQVKVTDANGCVQMGSVPVQPTSTLIVSAVASSPVCPATTGNVITTVSGSNPPFTYLWSNNTTGSSITGAATGYYSVKVTDAAGCTVSKGDAITQISPINVGFNTTPASCVFLSDGAALASASGGQSPYNYSWSNSQTGASITGLAPGNYYVTVTDANGCKNKPGNSLAVVTHNQNNNSCYCTITGTIYNDLNSDCIINTGESGHGGVAVHISGIGFVFTNSNGVYSAKVPSGTYTVSEITTPVYTLTSCETNSKVVVATASANCVMTVNFANTIAIIHDVHVITSNMNQAVPGNSYSQKIIVQNDGTVTENSIKFGYEHDGQLSLSNSTGWTFVQQNSVSYPNWYSINSGFPNLSPNAASSSIIQYNVPTNIPVNTVVNFKDTVAHAGPINTVWLTDNTPWNNVNSSQVVVVASYDPNYKEVMPKGLTANGNITSKDSILTYVIHFQNTGTYFAQNIVLVDSLDNDLNMTTLRPGYSEYPYHTTMSDNGVVKFHFDNINLPWQEAYGDMMSSGLVTYSIKMKKNLALGTQITNKAAIYFDYNEPVITNKTLNTLVSATPGTGLAELHSISGGEILLFPNPSSGDVTIVFEGKNAAAGLISITDISGRQLSSQDITIEPGTNSFVNRTSEFQSGIYLVTIKSETETVTKKLVIAK